ncbi:MAG: M23 family metallopeptidase [Desulfovibrio sp.]|nr:M23 family metallopeptidase [Desulfovibrio sp.]
MSFVKYCRTLTFTAWLIFLVAAPAVALTLEVPERVARGDAFPVTVMSNTPLRSVTFRWLGKKHVIAAIPVNVGVNIGAQARRGGVANRRTQWRASILLPVPLDCKENGQNLTAGAQPEYASDMASSAPLVRRVAFYDKKRPVQKLNVDRKYVNPPAEQTARIKADREKVRNALSKKMAEHWWSLPLHRPVPDRGVSSQFGLKRVFNGQPRGVHRGLDLRAPQGETVTACADGVVVLTDDLYYSGNAVYINHGEGVFTAYLHLSRILVREGQRVRRGENVGLVGATGRVTGPHLHLSFIVQGESVDPQPFLGAQSPSSGKIHERQN